MANSEAGERIGESGRLRIKRRRNLEGKEGAQETKERKTSGASNPATQQAVE